MQVWSLASGSSGNCYLLESEGTRLLVECGRPYKDVLRYLERCSVDPRSLNGIVLTHAHGDHSKSAREVSDAFELPIYASRGTLGCQTLRDSSWARPIEDGVSLEVGQIAIHPFAVPHDCFEPLGFQFEADNARVGITTDLGFVPEGVRSRLADLDLLVLEANYDPIMLEEGRYPGFLKRRVAGTHGHLSNEDSARAVAGCGDRAASQVWLAHISERNNTHEHALGTMQSALKRKHLEHVQVAVTRHRRPSLYWNSNNRAQQLSLF